MANDIDPLKQSMYQGHFGAERHFHLGDIHQIAPASLPEITLATASFPCTDLSLARLRGGLSGAHSSAFWGFVSLLENFGDRRPPLILLENVTGFLTSGGGEDFRDALTALSRLDYCMDAFVLDAAAFAPQSLAAPVRCRNAVEIFPASILSTEYRQRDEPVTSQSAARLFVSSSRNSVEYPCAACAGANAPSIGKHLGRPCA